MALSGDNLASLLAAPALDHPEGIVPNFDNPTNKNGLAWFVTTFCMAIATLCLLIRAYARIIMLKQPGIEEGIVVGIVLVLCFEALLTDFPTVLMLFAYGAYWGTAYAGYAMIFTPGYYVHTWDLTNGDLVRPLYLILVYGSSYSAVMPLLKSAILLDWCRVLVPDRTRNMFWWGCMAIITLQVVWGITCIVLLNMQCVPHAAIYEFYLESKCYSLSSVMLTSASVQVFTDFTMVLLPQRIIWGLNMNWHRKIGISLIFGVGILACVGASVRLSTTVTFAHESDTMYYIGPLLFWACAEMTCGFFILCVPCLPKVLSESGISRTISSAFKLSNKASTGPSESDPKHGTPGSSRDRFKSAKILGRYRQMDDDGIPLGNTQASESDEDYVQHGHDAVDRSGERGVTRTTHITVSSSFATGANDSESSIPWKG
ncbi:hypothetical protein JX266_010856 [Neoarthrinium moseri]|nr:hypothetical protein JX266_010856 [Neoarthrinium moseri]